MQKNPNQYKSDDEVIDLASDLVAEFITSGFLESCPLAVMNALLAKATHGLTARQIQALAEITQDMLNEHARATLTNAAQLERLISADGAHPH